MDGSLSIVSVILGLLLFTTFVKTATVLSIARYGLGLVGFEFGAVCFFVALGMAWLAVPPELASLGFPDALFSKTQSIQPQVITQSLVPYMERRIDPEIAAHFKGSTKDGVANDQGVKVHEKDSPISSVAPAYLLSQLKEAFQLGCMILIPLVTVDLLVAHVLALIGTQNIAAAAVALPLKILLFIAAGGWGLLGKKLLGLE
jgi:type III secretory pathway component EscR